MNKSMKKIVKKILLAISILLVLLIVFAVGFYYKMKSELKNMKPVPTGEVITGVFGIKDSYVNMFFLRDSAYYVAIDAGNSKESVATEMKTLGIDPDDVKAVFLTHSDPDHVGALELFKNAKVYMSDAERDMMNGKKHKFLWFNNSLGGREFTTLQDGQVVDIGTLKIKGILTAGHSSGAMCFVVNDSLLFTGDIITLKDGNKIAPSIKFFDMDHEEAIASVPLITNLQGVKYIFTAHCGYTNEYKKATEDWNE